MGGFFEISNSKFELSKIKDYGFQDRKYIYRPSYIFDNTVIKRLKHCAYSYTEMVPYALFADDTDIDSIPFETKLPNGALGEEKSSVIKASTKEYHSSEIRIVQCLVIVTDVEYCFYGNGIDCENIKKEYKRLQLLMKGEKTDNVAIDALCGAVTTKDNAVKWYNGLTANKKTILTVTLGVAAMIVLSLCLVVFSLLIDKDNDESTTNTTQQSNNTTIYSTTEKTTDSTTIQSTTSTTTVTTTIEPTISTTQNIPETTKEETVAAVIVTTAEPTTEEEKSGITVYITPTGKKYHYSSACAGKNAMKRDLDDVNSSYEPCKKCS